MNAQQPSKPLAVLERVSMPLAGLCIAVGAAALIGWQWNISSLKSVMPGFVAMNPLTAVAFMMAGCSFVLQRSPARAGWTRGAGLGLAAAAMLVGLCKLGDILFHTSFQLDQLLFRDRLQSVGALPPNRMAPNTALNFALVGLALVLLPLRLDRGYRPYQLVVLFPLGFSLLAILGYLLDVEELYGLRTYIPMALNTALTFLSLSVAILFARPREGLTSVFMADDAGGAMARRFMPLVIAIPALLACIRIQAHRAGLFELEPGVSVMVFASIALLSGLLWFNATRLSKADAERQAALAELQGAHLVLDQRVRERTAELAETANRLQREVDERARTAEALRASEAQLRQAQKMEAVGRLAGGVAHDFNNLLTAIMGYSQLMRRRPGVSEAAMRDIGEVEKAADRAAGLTRQLLAFSRQQVLQPKVLDLNHSIIEIDKMLRRLIGEDIDLLTVPAPELGHVKADPGQIEQVLLNLVVNARDAMPDGGKLTIETRNIEVDESLVRSREGLHVGPYVMLAVSDNGTGMDAETKARIFEPFFTTKEVGRGTGLGLSTVHGIVKQSGGHVEVYSELGKGSTFKVYLPRVDAPLDAKLAASVETEELRGSETILVVEDEEMVRQVVCENLRMNGYQVLEAADRREALSLLERSRRERVEIDLMLTDVIMPGMSIVELQEQSQGLHPRMKVVFMSGYTDRAMFHQGVLKDDALFIQKPFRTEALLLKVREALTEPRAAA